MFGLLCSSYFKKNICIFWFIILKSSRLSSILHYLQLNTLLRTAKASATLSFNRLSAVILDSGFIFPALAFIKFHCFRESILHRIKSELLKSNGVQYVLHNSSQFHCSAHPQTPRNRRGITKSELPW